MRRFKLLSYLSSSALLALAFGGCATDTQPSGDTGSLSLELVIAEGVEIDEVAWQITGNGMDMTGSIDVTAPGSTASVEVFGLPPGAENYLVTLTAESVDEQVGCVGSAEFNVAVGEVTEVMVVLNCKLPRRFGSVRVNGEFNICAELIKAVVSPLQTSVGNDIDVSAQAVDQDGDPITFAWTATGGSIADPSSDETTYTCEAAGAQTITISVTDNDEYCDMANWTVPVTCVGGAPECTEDADCAEGEICVDNECVVAPECTEDADCAEGEICVDDECVAAPECTEDADCAEGEVCVDNECVVEVGCTEDADCAEGEICVNNMCVIALECTEDADCAEGEVCVDNECVVEAECQTGADCGDGNECTADLCTDGVCSNPPVADGSSCAGGTCQSGVCVPDDACENVDCSDGNECTADVCTDGVCSNPPVEDGSSCTCPVCGAEGLCMMGECVDPCDDVNCDDGNDCTADLCDVGQCSNLNLDAGTPCAGGVCDGAGTCAECVVDADCAEGETCDGGSCVVVSDPIVGAGSDSTSWRALPTTATGCTYDAAETICTNCTLTGPPVPGGGQCGQFGAQIVGGCEVPGGVLNAQLAIDTTITLEVSSTGDGNVTHDFSVIASNPALGTAAGLVSVDAATLFASVTSGSPAQLENALNPAVAGDILGLFTGGGNVLLLDNDPSSVPSNLNNGVEIPSVTTPVTPTSSPAIGFNYETFSLVLTIQASGTPLIVDDAGCIFDEPGGAAVLPVE